jgi:hypothetical protein
VPIIISLSLCTDVTDTQFYIELNIDLFSTVLSNVMKIFNRTLPKGDQPSYGDVTASIHATIPHFFTEIFLQFPHSV